MSSNDKEIGIISHTETSCCSTDINSDSSAIESESTHPRQFSLAAVHNQRLSLSSATSSPVEARAFREESERRNARARELHTPDGVVNLSESSETEEGVDNGVAVNTTKFIEYLKTLDPDNRRRAYNMVSAAADDDEIKTKLAKMYV